ncbi:NHL repeat-containing protein [candidate division KSB1 bacterium]|nr:NHL repeat-containing protein [candidate division KSB1 bacterium]
MHKKFLSSFWILFILSTVRLHPQELQIKFHHQIDLSACATNTATTFNNLSVSTENLIYIVDAGLNRILMTDSLGHFIREVGGFGWELQQFDQPTAVWAENALDVFVADYNNSRIQRFDRTLNFVSAIIGDEILADEKKFAFPVAVAWSRFGDLFIIESELQRVIQFNELGEPLRTFGDYDEGAGRLVTPVDLCVSDENKIFVADRGRRSVIKFDYYGNFLQELPFHSMAQIEAISWLQNKIFVLDGKSNRCAVSSETGEIFVDFSPVIQQSTTKTRQITDLCIQRNRLYFLDDNQKLIHVYTMSNRGK